MSVISTGAARTLPVPWLRLAALLVGAALLWVALDLIMDAGAQVSGAHVQRFDQAVLLAPGGVDSGLAPIRLPGNCHAHGECLQRYRLTVRHGPIVSGQYALYIPQFTGRLEVTLDGVSIIDSNLDETSLRFGQGAPKLVALPARLLQEGSNEFGLALGDRLGAGAVGPIYFGPEVTLRPSYETAYFLVVTLLRLMDGVLLAIGAIMLMIWL